MALDQFLCWKLKTATVATIYFIIVTATVAAILEILDIAALGVDSFEILGGFKSYWRAHVWEGWLACNIVMLVLHLIMIAFSILLYFAVKRFPTYYEYHITKTYVALLIIYILAELGIACYRFSWYGPNTFRLPYLVFTFLYWLCRALVNITCVFIIWSRIAEIDYEIMYGEKKIVNPYSAGAHLLESAMRSGYTTPGGRSGTATPSGRPYAYA